jgi:D-3-phosphoglycerate dehydrogenase
MVDLVREVLTPSGARVEIASAPWAGDDVVGLLVWSPVGAGDLARLPGLRVIATPSVGFDHVDLAVAESRGVWVCNVPDYCIDEVADSTIALTLALMRGVVALDRAVRHGTWDDHAAGPLPAVRGARLGVIGFGRIGRAVGERAEALGMQVIAHDPLVPSATASIDELLASADVVTLHVPLTPLTRHLIGARELGLMRRGAFLVNTSRAGLVDDAAMMEALEAGALGGAALDVLTVEPPTAEHPAPRHQRLIVTPHSAWYSPHAEREVFRRAAESIRAVLDGREPEDAVLRPRS